MSFSGLASNQAVSYNNLQDAVNNGIFTLIATIGATGQESTKSYVAAHVSGFPTNYPPYANKASNQLIVKGDIYNVGNFTINAGYGVSFTSLTGTNFPTFSFPISTSQTVTYFKQIPAQTFNGRISGSIGSNSLGLYVDGILVDQIPGTDISGGNFSLNFPNAINPPTSILLQINSGITPTPPVPPTPSTFSGKSFSTVAVNRGSGQYMVAGNTNLYSSSGYTAGYIFYSTNYGSTWTQSLAFGYWSKVASSDNGQYVLAVEQYGKAYLSSNYGASFNAIGSLGSNFFTSAALSNSGQFQIITTINSNGPSIVYGSSNYGATWSAILTAGGFEGYYSCAIDASDSNYLVGGGVGGQSFMYRSTNYGASWTTVFTNSTGSSVNDININATNGWAIASQYGTSFAGSNLIKSSNSGASWSNITGGSATQSWVRSILNNTVTGLAIYQLGNSNTSYIQQVTGPGPVFLNTVGDLTSSGNRNWHSLACSDNGTYILAGAGNGLWLSTNGGSSFTQL